MTFGKTSQKEPSAVAADDDEQTDVEKKKRTKSMYVKQ